MARGLFHRIRKNLFEAAALTCIAHVSQPQAKNRVQRMAEEVAMAIGTVTKITVVTILSMRSISSSASLIFAGISESSALISFTSFDK